MSSRARLILAVAVVLVVCVLFYFLFVRGRQSELDSLNQQIADENNQTLQLQSELARLEDLRDRAPELEAELAEIRDFVPQNHEVDSFIFQVQEAADEAGVDFVEIAPEQPKPPPEGAPLAEVRLALGAEGGYFALQDFLRRLYALDRAVRVDLMQMVGSEEGDGGDTTIELDLTARIFFELPAGAGTAPAATTPVAPAPAPTPAPAATTPAPTATP